MVFRECDKSLKPLLREFGRLQFNPQVETSLIRDLHIPDKDAFIALMDWLKSEGLIEILRGIKEEEPKDHSSAAWEAWKKVMLESKGMVTGFSKTLDDDMMDVARSTFSLMAVLSVAGKAKEFFFRVLKAKPLIEYDDLGVAERPDETQVVNLGDSDGI